MTSGLDITLRLLAETDNDVADQLLLVGLDSGSRALAEQSLVALVARETPYGEQQVLRRWKSFLPHLKAIVAEHLPWMSQTLRHIVEHRDAELFPLACEAMIDLGDYDQMPTLVDAACDSSRPFAAESATTVLQLAELLHEELMRPRDYRNRRDPQMQRAYVISCLERAVSTVADHGRHELVEAFLLVAGHDNMTLRRMLQSPADRSFAAVAAAMQNSTRAGVQRLMLQLLEDPTAPLASLAILARRHDLMFVRSMLRKIGSEPSPAVRANLRRIENIPWMQDNLSLLDALAEQEQAGAVQLAVLSHLPRSHSLGVLAAILRLGHQGARRLAAEFLVEFPTAAAGELAIRVLDDPDPSVRAAVVTPLRKRMSPTVLSRLVQMLDSPHAVERIAVQHALEDFQFARYLANFDSLTSLAKESTGAIVRKVDPETTALLRIELTSKAKVRQRRALEMILSLHLVEPLLDTLSAVLDDEDQFLRLEALRVLGTIDTPETRLAIRRALTDSHPLVRDTAERLLADFANSPRKSQPTSDTQPLHPHGLAHDTVPLAAMAHQGRNPATGVDVTSSAANPSHSAEVSR